MSSRTTAHRTRCLPQPLKAAAVGVPVLALITWVAVGWIKGPARPPSTLTAERVPAAELPMTPARQLPDVVPAVGTAPAAEVD